LSSVLVVKMVPLDGLFVPLGRFLGLEGVQYGRTSRDGRTFSRGTWNRVSEMMSEHYMRDGTDVASPGAGQRRGGLVEGAPRDCRKVMYSSSDSDD